MSVQEVPVHIDQISKLDNVVCISNPPYALSLDKDECRKLYNNYKKYLVSQSKEGVSIDFIQFLEVMLLLGAEREPLLNVLIFIFREGNIGTETLRSLISYSIREITTNKEKVLELKNLLSTLSLS